MEGFFSGVENGGELVRFFWSKKKEGCWAFFYGVENLQQQFYLQQKILFSQYFRQSRRLICAVAVKGNFFEDSFRVRYSSICLDLRLDLPIILFTIFG